jgi:diguanylate cyclase (GGDEF)-like protein
MAVARRASGSAAVLFIDFDGFKAVNDLRGHAAGDAVLREMARRLAACTRDTDLVARLGGDEFVVVAERLDDPSAAAILARKLLRVVGEPVVIGGETVALSASIGISLFPGDGASADELVRAADAAMYAAKADGRDAFRHYSARMQADARDRLTVEEALRAALERREFVLQYQPRWDVAAGRVTACDARLHWQRPDVGVTASDAFLPAADRCGVSVPLARLVLEAACDQAARLRHAGFALPIAVEMTPRQLADRALARDLDRMLRAARLRGDALEVRVSEATAAACDRHQTATLRELYALGVGLTVSGFGLGCSSLGCLTALPVDGVAIDARIVRGLSGDPDRAALAGAVVALARPLGLTVVADGVATAEQARILAAHGCDHMQGAYFAEPLPQSELSAYLRWACSPVVGSDGRAPHRPAPGRRPLTTRRPQRSSHPPEALASLGRPTAGRSR